MYIRDGKRFNPYADTVVGGVLYPSGTILDHPQAMADLGVVEIPEPDKPADYSPLLYIRVEQDTAPLVVYQRREQADIDAQVQRQTNEDAERFLAETDWYVLRFADEGVSIPEDIKQARREARAAIVR